MACADVVALEGIKSSVDDWIISGVDVIMSSAEEASVTVEDSSICSVDVAMTMVSVEEIINCVVTVLEHSLAAPQ